MCQFIYLQTRTISIHIRQFAESNSMHACTPRPQTQGKTYDTGI